MLLAFAGAAWAQFDATAAKARRDQEDEQWARRSNLPVADVKAIRIAAGITDDSDTTKIVTLSANGLAGRNQILLGRLAGGRCISVHVIQRADNGFKQIWALKDPPPDSKGLCSKAPRPPSVSIDSEHRIVVEIPIMMDAFERSIPTARYVYAWDGATYKLVSEER